MCTRGSNRALAGGPSTPPLEVAWAYVWRFRVTKCGSAADRLYMRVDRQGMIRALVAVLGILVGLGVYSYGMFHTLLPAPSKIIDVANCGVSPGASYQTVDTRAPGSSDLPLCQVAPGQWTKTPYRNGPFFLALAIAFGSTMVALNRTSLLKVATSSAPRTVTLFLLIFGIPTVLLGLQLNLIEGTLTADWALHVVIYGLLTGAVMGLLTWYTVVRPLRAKAASNNRWKGP